jgi:hypothetical protein
MRSAKIVIPSHMLIFMAWTNPIDRAGFALTGTPSHHGFVQAMRSLQRTVASGWG